MEDVARACVLTVTSKSCKSEGTGCGILIDTRHGYVIAHSSVLAPFLLDKPQLIGQLESGSKHGTALSGILNVNTEVLLERVKSQTVPEEYSLMKYRTSLVNSSVYDKSPHKFVRSAELCSFFKCVKFEQAMRKFLPENSWCFVDNKKEPENSSSSKLKNNKSMNNEDEQLYRLMPCFVLLKLNQWTPYESVLRIRSTRTCRVGECVELLTTPFANLFPEIMLNSVSRGIICNLSGRNQCLILSDARCMPGSEGGPLFTCESGDESFRHLTGMVVSSMCWKNGEWLGFSLSCSIHEILASIPQATQEVLYEVEQGQGDPTGSRRSLMRTLDHVALLKVGSTWGSGVILGEEEGLVLTCSHVIKDSQSHPVQLKQRPSSSFLKCRVLHSSPVGVQFDLALLSCASLESHKSCLPLAYPIEGSQVYIIGHATFGYEYNMKPSVTSGVVSKVVKVNDIPVMVQTTCAVHPGASGGALVDAQGRLVGMVVSNAKDMDTGASFPHINMCVPLITVWPVIKAYMKSKDVEVLRHLNLKNVSIDRLWTLGKPASETTKMTSHL